MVRASAVAFLLAVPATALAQIAPPDISPGVWRCIIARQSVCGLAGCRETKPAVEMWLDPSDGTYERCSPGRGDCDRYEASYSRAGAFLTGQVVGSPLLVRLSGDGSYSEDAALGHDHYLSFGVCREAPPPINISVEPK